MGGGVERAGRERGSGAAGGEGGGNEEGEGRWWGTISGEEEDMERHKWGGGRMKRKLSGKRKLM